METTSKCILGGSALGSRKETSYETGRRAVHDLVQSIENGSCVDRYVQDQLIVFMALAKGISRIRTDFPLTLHTQTGIYIAELLTDVSRLNIKSKPTNEFLINSAFLIGQIHRHSRWVHVCPGMRWDRSGK